MIAAPASSTAESEHDSEQQEPTNAQQNQSGLWHVPWCQQELSRLDLELYSGLYYDGNTLVISVSVKTFVLKELRDDNYSGLHIMLCLTVTNMPRIVHTVLGKGTSVACIAN